MEPAYPPRFYAERIRSRAWATVPLGVLGFFEVGFAYVLWMGAGNVLQVLGLGIVSWFIFCVIRGHVKAWRNARIFPYYDKLLPKAETYLSGQALLRNCLRLDRLAEEKGIRSISGYGFPDALRGEKVVWHDAADGLQTIEALLKEVSERPQSVDDASTLISDLAKIRDAFERAKNEGIKFSFLIEEMGGTSLQVWEIRKGYV